MTEGRKLETVGYAGVEGEWKSNGVLERENIGVLGTKNIGPEELWKEIVDPSDETNGKALDINYKQQSRYAKVTEKPRPSPTDKVDNWRTEGGWSQESMLSLWIYL